MIARVNLVSPSPLPDALLEAVQRLAPEGVASDQPWGHGWSALIEHAAPESLRESLRPIAEGVDVSVVTGPLATEFPRLLMMDVDSTFTTSEAIDELAHEAGVGEQVAEITARAMRGELDFAHSLAERVATLVGLDEDVLRRVAERTELSPGARELVTAAKANGARVGLVSGGFAEIVGIFAEGVGVDDITANHLEVVEGRLTGRTLGEVIDRAAKARHLLRNCELAGCPAELAVAVGDGANDLAMMGAAGLGIAYCAKPLAAAQADTTVSHPRLDAVLGHLAPH